MKSIPPSIFNTSLLHEVAEKIKQNGNIENNDKHITISETKKYYSSFIPSRQSEKTLLAEVDTLLSESFANMPEKDDDASIMIQSLSEKAQFFLKELDRKMSQKPTVQEKQDLTSETNYETVQTPLLEKSFQTLKEKDYRYQ